MYIILTRLYSDNRAGYPNILPKFQHSKQTENNLNKRKKNNLKVQIYFTEHLQPLLILGDPEVTANIHCKSRNLPNTDTQNYTTVLR